MKGIVATLAIIAAAGALGYQWWHGSQAAAQMADNSTRWFVDAETHQAFQKKLALGMTVPVKSPYTNRATGYPAELCYWTKDGKPKKDPTPVLLNSEVGIDGPTFCPDCGRLVVGRNPAPEARMKAPPTQEEYERSHQTADVN
ncbi:MAG TPA: hypothetical protein VH253_01410 [Phycisphaerae bacterium]|nr:hypothetical protein [Phycisphaerae bacterium]